MPEQIRREADAGVGSLATLQIRRRKPANAGWVVGDRAREVQRHAQETKRAAPEPSAAAGEDAAVGRPGPAFPDIYAYWCDHRDGRPFPAWSDFDPDDILAQWPNSVLLACGGDLRQPRLAASFTESLRAAKRKEAEALVPSVEYTPLLTDWLLSLGKEVARLGKPLNDSEALPALKGRVRYRVVGLPLGESPLAVDHVLCHVVRG